MKGKFLSSRPVDSIQLKVLANSSSLCVSYSPSFCRVEYMYVLVRVSVLLCSFPRVFARLVSCGFHTESAALGFCQSVVSLLADRASSVESEGSLVAMWSDLVNQLLALVNRVGTSPCAVLLYIL